MKTSHLLVLAGLAVAPALAQQGPRPLDPTAEDPTFIGWVEDELIVVLDRQAARALTVSEFPGEVPQMNRPSLQTLAISYQLEGFARQFPTAKPQHLNSIYPDLTGHYKIKLGNGQSLENAVLDFSADPSVERVERIGVHRLYDTPNDTFYDNNSPDQWHLYGANSVDADLAWDAETGSDQVLVGILDSGVRYFHIDLGGYVPQWGPNNPSDTGNIFINPGEIPGNGIDDDNNGYIDDTIGYDFVQNAGGGGVKCIDADCGGADNDPDDYNGHGTHVAGTVAAITNNDLQVAGVAGGWSDGTLAGVGNGAKIVPMRIGYHARYQGFVTGIVRMDYAAEAMNYLADLKQAGHNVAAINCSWGSSNSGGLGAAISNLVANDVMIIHAAGNSNSSFSDYLGSRPDVVSVAATSQSGAGASFTNHGSWVDVAAPGVDILSTWRNPNDSDPTVHYIDLLDGTSMAAPHVAGIAALLESCSPGLTGPQKRALIEGNTTPYSDSRNLGTGIANANLALIAAGCGGGVPCDLTASFTSTATSGCASHTVSFTDTSTGSGVNAWAWDFGDGNTSSAQNPSHTYTTAGIYSVSLTVFNNDCNDGTTSLGLVSVSDVPLASFSATPTSGNNPLEVSFVDLSSGNPTAWSWDFGDGGSSSAQSPSHTYTTSGNYNVSLTVTSACGSDQTTSVGLITVNDPPPVTSCRVNDINVIKVNLGQGWKRAEATIRIEDNAGNPVAGATVVGDFTGKTTDLGMTGVTNGLGEVILLSSQAKGGGEWCFEVTSVSASGLTYDAAANLVTQSCDSSGDIF